MPSLELVPPALAIFAVVLASYTDLRWRLIPNKLTLPLIAAGVIFHLAVGLSRADLLVAVSGIVGAGFAFILGYALWLAGGWAGGDVKLFTALGALLQTHKPALYPASLSILFNGAIVAAPILLVYALVCLARGQGIFKRGVRITELKEGMIPAELIYEFEGKVRRESGWRIRPKGKVLANPNVAAGLTRGKVRALKRLVREGKLEDSIRIKLGMPFAPVLAAGVLVLLAFGDLWLFFIESLTRLS